MSGHNELLEAALAYTQKGWPVFPCKAREKAPLTPHGFKDATTDQATIRHWWMEHPAANIGVATGRASGVVVIDVDGPEGEESLKALPPLPETFTVRTARGRHLYFACGEPLHSTELAGHWISRLTAVTFSPLRALIQVRRGTKLLTIVLHGRYPTISLSC